MISFDDAAAIICDNAKTTVGSELVPIAQAAGRVLAAAVFSRVNSPPSDVSAMDGYAVRDEDLLNLPAMLRVIGASFAGTEDAGTVAPSSCIRIFTGAPLPQATDRVVVQEVVRREGDVAIFSEQLDAGRHIRRRGSDFREGVRLIEPGRRLGYRQMVAAAGADLASLSVWPRPVVHVLGTGDELTEPGSAAEKPGSIPESLSFGIAALAEDWGAAVQSRVRLRDDLEEMGKAAASALEQADLVVVTGGASVGEKDFAKAMFAKHGLELLFSKVAIKPGKPAWLGRASGKLILGLPGNPTSALVTARLLLAPLVAGLSGLDPKSAFQWRETPLLSPLAACGERETFVRGRGSQDGVDPLTNQDSSSQGSLVEADLLIRRRPGSPAAKSGDAVSVLDF